MPRCGIVILAAGGSTRMGSAKQLLEFEGASLLRRAVITATASTCGPIVVVLGSKAAELKDQLQELPARVVVNENWSAGMGTSIRAGVTAIGAVDAVMIFLCDQPMISTSALNDLAAAHFKSGKQITAAFYAGTFGTPAVFAASLFAELQALEDDQGGKAILHRHAGQVHAFALPEAAVDVDTIEDFKRLIRHA